MIGVVLGLLLGAGGAAAQELRVVVEGQTLGSVAADLGDPELEAELRRLNEFGPGEEPLPRDVLVLPNMGAIGQQAFVSYVGGGGVADLGGVSVPLTRGMCLAPGTKVCTADDGFAAIRIEATDDSGTHDDISLLPSTCITIQGVSSRMGQRAAVVQVNQGAVSVASERQRDGSLAVTTRDGVMLGNKGTFRVTVEPAATRTEALTAPVAIFGAGKQLNLQARQGNRVSAGQAPGDPVELLDEGSPIEPYDGAPLRWTDFSWVPVPETLGYRIYLATDAEFTELLLKNNVRGSPWTPPVLVLPYEIPGLWWRITAVDHQGYEGMPSVSHALVIPTGVGQ